MSNTNTSPNKIN